MGEFANISLFTITLAAMVISLILSIVIPVLPGHFLIWLAALIYGLLTGWESLTVSMFVVITVLTLIAAIIDAVAGWVGARKGGASWVGVAIGLVLGFLGTVFFNVFGAIAGVIVGIMGYEYYRQQDWGLSWKAAKGFLVGTLVSLVGRLAISIMIVAIFIWQVL